MLEDQTLTERQQVAKQPGACIQCHASVYVAYKKLGDGDLMKGFRKNESDAIFRNAQTGDAIQLPASIVMIHKRCNCV